MSRHTLVRETHYPNPSGNCELCRSEPAMWLYTARSPVDRDTPENAPSRIVDTHTVTKVEVGRKCAELADNGRVRRLILRSKQPAMGITKFIDQMQAGERELIGVPKAGAVVAS